MYNIFLGETVQGLLFHYYFRLLKNIQHIMTTN